MRQFDSIAYNLPAAEAELQTFKAWLGAAGFVGKTEIVREIRARRRMCCLLASRVGMSAPDLIRFELALKGMLRADLILGNDHFRQFVLIEFEDAKENSIFSGGTRRYRHWARRPEHGFGQVVDWAWIRSDHPDDTVLTAAFGGRINVGSCIVVCGRDEACATMSSASASTIGASASRFRELRSIS